MNSRERFLAALRRQMPDRVPRSDGFPWPETLQRWQTEGLAKDQAIHDVLDLDRITGAHFPVDIGYPVRRLFQKYHRRIKEWAQRHDLPIIYHCDGDVREFIPLLIEEGIDCIQPLEARCGNDVRVYKREYGRDIALFGNISMDIVARGDRRAIEQEVVSKIETAKAGGGYIHHSDHSVPPTVSWATCCYPQALAREYGGN